MNLNITPLTWWCLGIIITTFICSLAYIEYLRRKDRLISSRRSIEYLPTLVSTLGVLGTFLGITLGLLDFNPLNITGSIETLLNGLKTAFFTSLAGMIGSVILSGYLNKSQDNKDGGISDINQAAGSICQAVKKMSDLNAEAINALKQQITEQETDRRAFYRTMGDAIDNLKVSQSFIANNIADINTSSLAAKSALDSLVLLQRSQEVTISSIKNDTGEVAENTHHVGEILDIVAGMSSTQDRINDQVQKLKDILDAEVDQIEQSMNQTNKLLERKFNDFTELLKKSNTEALVEVMKKVTEEFQKQMNSLINKLIQENFEQLNKSVERLNLWQQENKEMIASLTIQYKEMAMNFEATSMSLVRVKEDTQSLVSEGGKLRQIVDALNEVIVHDEKFIQTATHLQKTAELSQSNMESFDESTKALNEWIRKQRNFVDGVTLLIEKLEEIGRIKDYNEQFWKGTRQQMEEGVAIISKGTQTLNTQLTSLDQSFYRRLGATLAELDNCITKMVEQVGK